MPGNPVRKCESAAAALSRPVLQPCAKPAGALAFFDPGISATVGSGVLMEAHKQNPAMLRAAEHGGGRLGGLPAAWLLQLGLPLLVVVAGYAIWAGERESGTLRLHLVQGGRWWPLLLGKALALVAVTAAIGLPLAAACSGPVAAVCVPHLPCWPMRPTPWCGWA